MEFTFNLETKQLDAFAKKFKESASKEIKEAIKDTAVYGLREAINKTPKRTGTASKSWRWGFKNSQLATIFSNNKYIINLSEGWTRTKPILPVKAKVLVFQVAKRTAAKSATTTLYKRYKTAMAKLKGKGLNQKEKAQLVTQQTGVVVTKAVNTSASFKGYKFIDDIAFKTGYFFGQRVSQAIDRVVK